MAPSTQARDASYLKTLILPYLGDLALRQINIDTLNDWVGELEEMRAPATVRKAFELAAAVLDHAVRARKLPSNPARVRGAVELPRLHDEPMRFLSAEEVTALADAVDPRYRALVLTAAWTGLRWGELAALRAKNLDFGERRIRVVQTLSEVAGKVAFKKPKSKASARSVTLPGFLIDELRAHLRAWPAVGDGLVFQSPSGSPLLRGNFRRRVWLPAVEASGLAPLRFHDLRHTHASLLIAEGVHVKAIAARMGHSQIAVTMDRYGHLLPGVDDDIAARLERAARA